MKSIKIITAKIAICLISIIICASLAIRSYFEQKCLKEWDANFDYVIQNEIFNKFVGINQILQLLTDKYGRANSNGARATTIGEFLQYEHYLNGFKESCVTFNGSLKWSSTYTEEEMISCLNKISTKPIEKVWGDDELFIDYPNFVDKNFADTEEFLKNYMPSHDIIYIRKYITALSVKILYLHSIREYGQAKEIYFKTLNLCQLLFNRNNQYSEVISIFMLQDLTENQFTNLKIFSDEEINYLSKLNLFISPIRGNSDAPLYKRLRMLTLSPVVYFYPDRFQKTITLLSQYKKRKFLMPIMVEFVLTLNTHNRIDDAGIIYPWSEDRRVKKMLSVYDAKNKDKLLRLYALNLISVNKQHGPVTIYDFLPQCTSGELIHIFATITTLRSKIIRWYLRPLLWYYFQKDGCS